jgi:hypothetical protein
MVNNGDNKENTSIPQPDEKLNQTRHQISGELARIIQVIAEGYGKMYDVEVSINMQIQVKEKNKSGVIIPNKGLVLPKPAPH